VPKEVLDPRSTWKDRAAYDATARKLAAMFDENFAQYADQVDPHIRSAGMRKAR
jgi:phosphoenolpyruvate carboxykinase (ATP)